MRKNKNQKTSGKDRMAIILKIAEKLPTKNELKKYISDRKLSNDIL